jgi:hypothetical protein
VKDALRAPELHVYDSRGHEVPPWTFPLILPVVPIVDDGLGSSTGAFPLPAGSKDVSRYYFLGGGSYTAELSAADGGAGTGILEIYEIPR